MNIMKTLSAILCLFLTGLHSIAQEESIHTFTHTLNTGATLTEGNSETLQAHAELLTEGEKEGLGSLRAGLEAHYGVSTVESNRETTVENLHLFGQAKRTLNARNFAAVNTEWLNDDIAKIDYRVTLGAGLGRYLAKNDRIVLSAEAGPAYLWERVAGARNDYLVLRIAEQFEHTLSETARWRQSLEYLPKTEDFADYLLNAEIGAEAALNAHLNLRITLKNKYDSTPGEGLKHNDLSLIAGIGLVF